MKIAARSVFFDETSKRVRTKKEITGEDGQIRKGCMVIPKGGIYEQHLKVFLPDSIYLPTMKIGKNNPKAEEIRADNAARQEWNRTADMALLSGISEAKIIKVKQTEIHEKVSLSTHKSEWLPGLFRSIVSKAKESRRPAKKESVRNRIRQLQAEDKQKPRRRSFDRER